MVARAAAVAALRALKGVLLRDDIARHRLLRPRRRAVEEADRGARRAFGRLVEGSLGDPAHRIAPDRRPAHPGPAVGSAGAALPRLGHEAVADRDAVAARHRIAPEFREPDRIAPVVALAHRADRPMIDVAAGLDIAVDEVIVSHHTPQSIAVPAAHHHHHIAQCSSILLSFKCVAY